MTWGRRLLVVAGAIALLGGLVTAPGAVAAAACPTKVGSSFTNVDELRALNQVMADAGPRPTASPAHEGYIDWVEEQIGSLPGMQVRSNPYAIDRWLEQGSSLGLVGPGGTTPIRVAGAVPYSRAGTVSGPLRYVPPTKAIKSVNVAGRVVIHDRAITGQQQAIFLAVADYVHDPNLSIDWTGNYERDVSAYQGIITDLEQAAAGGAAGVVFAATVPHEQAFSYAQYAGRHWDVPAVQVGADEGAALKAAAGSVAQLSVQAERTPGAPTRNVIATLPGRSPQRIVIASHTDGMNAVWDNGPTAIIALARWFSALPLRCRPRTLEFGFTTGHLYQSDVGAHRYTLELDRGYDEGTVALAVALEHLGAREHLPFPRGGGLPGVELRATGKSELFVTFSNESPVTKAALISTIIDRDLRRTFALRGADAPAADIPPHKSYGGEGGVYHQALIPTIAGITGPNTLFKPQYALDELLDVRLMRRQAMAFGDIVLDLDDVPRELIAGADTLYRLLRGGPATAAARDGSFYCDLSPQLSSARPS